MRNRRNSSGLLLRPEITPSYQLIASPPKSTLSQGLWQFQPDANLPQKTSPAKRQTSAELQDEQALGLARLEAVLFLSREPLNTRKLSQLAGLQDGTEARMLVKKLNAKYDDVGRAFRIEQVAGGFQLFSRRKFGPWLQRLSHIPSETRLSAPGLETLAVIAYRQPVLRADIEAIRGVNCGEIIRQLMERDLVRIGGRSEELGRPYLYSTTRRFLNLFGLASLEELPRGDELREISLEGFQGEATAPGAGFSMLPMAESEENSSDGEGSFTEENGAEDEEADGMSPGAFWGPTNSLESTLADPSGE